jgi:GTPase SAR1 family protein
VSNNEILKRYHIINKELIRKKPSMMNKALDYAGLFKIIIYGPSGVGKTLMLRKYSDNYFGEE